MKKASEIRAGLAWGGGLILLAGGAGFAHTQGYVDQESTLRLLFGANGLMVAYFGNRAPKAVAPSAYARQVNRFAGWSMVLSGLVYAGLWVFAPTQQAIVLGTATVAVGVLATLSYCFRLRARTRVG